MALDIEHKNAARESGMKRAAERLRKGQESEELDLWEHVDLHETALRITNRKLSDESDDLLEFQEDYEQGYFDVFDNFDEEDLSDDE